MLALLVGELRSHRVDRGEHATDPEARDHTPGHQLVHVAGVSRHEHADEHEAQTPEDRRPATDLVRHAAEEQRAQGHAEQLRRQHVAQLRLVDLPRRLDAGTGERDRQHVEAVQGIETDSDRNRGDLHGTHRTLGYGFARVGVNRLHAPLD